MATMAVALDRNLFLAYYSSGWFPNLTRAYGNNGRRPRQKFVFGILQLWLVSKFDEGLWQQWPSPSTEICFWHIRAYSLIFWLVSKFDEGLWQQWPSPSTEICFWHITALVGFQI